MAWLSWLVLESTAALAGLLGLVLFFLLVYWRRGGSMRPLLIGLGAALVLFVTQALIVTPREHAAAVLGRIEREIESGRTAALAEALSPAFRAADMDRATFLEYARRQLQVVRVQWSRRTDLQVEMLSGDRFLAIASFQAGITIRDAGATIAPSRWRITFARGQAGWEIVTIDPPEVAGTKFPGWDIRP